MEFIEETTAINIFNPNSRKIKCIENEFSFFDKCFESRIKKEIPAKFGEILDFYFSKKGKRLRPALIFLILKSMGLEIAEKHYLLAFAMQRFCTTILLTMRLFAIPCPR